MLLAFIYAVGVVLKTACACAITKSNERALDADGEPVSLQPFARTWHLFALIYFMVFVLAYPSG